MTQRRAHVLYRKYIRALLDEAKDRPCTDCNRRYPSYVMQFDHLNPRKKLFNLSQARTGLIEKTAVLRELAKCEVVCANCHAIRTHRRL